MKTNILTVVTLFLWIIFQVKGLYVPLYLTLTVVIVSSFLCIAIPFNIVRFRFKVKNLETKFSLNDKIWIIHENKVIQSLITLIEIDEDGSIKYRTKIFERFSEEDCFATKEELIKSIKEQ